MQHSSHSDGLQLHEHGILLTDVFSKLYECDKDSAREKIRRWRSNSKWPSDFFLTADLWKHGRLQKGCWFVPNKAALDKAVEHCRDKHKRALFLEKYAKSISSLQAREHGLDLPHIHAASSPADPFSKCKHLLELFQEHVSSSNNNHITGKFSDFKSWEQFLLFFERYSCSQFSRDSLKRDGQHVYLYYTCAFGGKSSWQEREDRIDQCTFKRHAAAGHSRKV